MNKNIMEELQKPFEPNEIEFRVGSTNGDKTMGLALAYIEARAIQNRLDRVLGVEGWKVSYKEITGGFLAKLEIKIGNEWIAKEDGAQNTEFESLKGGISSAFKRVASSGYGIGRYLYSSKSEWHPIKQQGKGYVFVGVPKLGQETKNNEQKEEKNKEQQNYKNNNKENIEELKKIKLSFGKYSGKSLGELQESDLKYLGWIAEKSKDKNLVEACKVLIAS